MKRILFAVLSLVALFSFVSCEKSDDGKKDVPSGKELIGTWVGKAQPLLGNAYDMTLTFTESKVTFKDDENTNTFNYTIKEGTTGLFFEIDNDINSGFFYRVQGNVLEIYSGTSSYLINGKYTKQ